MECGPNATSGHGISNVLICNLTIRDINLQLVLGGDALDLGCKDVWTDCGRISPIASRAALLQALEHRSRRARVNQRGESFLTPFLRRFSLYR